MPIVNVVDNRTNKYDITVDGVVEPSWHDNSIEGATQFKRDDTGYTCYMMGTTTVEQAIKDWADDPVPYTLYLYDVGANDV